MRNVRTKIVKSDSCVHVRKASLEMDMNVSVRCAIFKYTRLIIRRIIDDNSCCEIRQFNVHFVGDTGFCSYNVSI